MTNGMEVDAACGFARLPLQDKRTRARLHPEAKHLGMAVANFVNIPALGLPGAGAGRF
jgi:hypothetical protein